MRVLARTSDRSEETLDPPDCGCTDCLTGAARPMTDAEFAEFGPIRVIRLSVSETMWVEP